MRKRKHFATLDRQMDGWYRIIQNRMEILMFTESPKRMTNDSEL